MSIKLALTPLNDANPMSAPHIFNTLDMQLPKSGTL
jgi:hypothetical protein